MSVEPVIASKSVAEHLRDTFRKRQANKTLDLEIPGYGALFGTFRALDDYAELREAIQDTARRRGISEADREIEIAVRTLLLASVSSYAVVDSQRVDIDLPLGVGLFDYIFPPDGSEFEVRPGSDSEAVHLLFDNTVALMVTAARLDQWFRGEGVATDEELVSGN